MASSRRTSPDHDTTGWPPGVPYIIGNEGCERFSYYGMRSILTLYLANVLYVHHPAFASDPGSYAKAHYHLFVAGVYALPMIGAIVADRLLGKYRTIFWLSLVYCAGHACLAAFEGSVWGVWTGLGLIAVGSGGIKPCVSANVGDQFGKNNWFRVRSIYQAFYFVINFGSFFSTLLIPWLWKKHGASVAFGVPGILMFIATVFFWAGRNQFVHVPPRPGGRIGLLDTLSSIALFMTFGHLFFTSSFPAWAMISVSAAFLILGLLLFRWRQRLQPDDGFLAVMFFVLFGGKDARVAENESPRPTSEADDVPKAVVERRRKLGTSRWFGPAVRRFGAETAEGPVAVLQIISVFFLVSIFWALFDQHGSSWILQAEQMDLRVWGDWKLLASQTAAVNPLLVMLLIPFMNYFVYRGLEKAGMNPSPLARMTAGMLVAAGSFVACALIQQAIDVEGKGAVSIWWQLVPYAIITVSEILVSITGLEFAYTQAPRRMKSTIMGFWLLTVSLGNVLVSIVSLIKLPPAQFFWVFAALMGAAGLLFGLRARFYVQQDYVQK